MFTKVLLPLFEHVGIDVFNDNLICPENDATNAKEMQLLLECVQELQLYVSAKDLVGMRART